MANIYLISYDLNKCKNDYKILYGYIKSFPYWVHIFESMWMIKSSKECGIIRNEINNTIYPEDKIFISKLNY